MRCWYDSAPDSSFLRTLYRRSFADISNAMFLGYECSGLGSPIGDDVVPLTSQLRVDARARSERFIGIDEDHVGILSAPYTLEQINLLFLEYGAP